MSELFADQDRREAQEAEARKARRLPLWKLIPAMVVGLLVGRGLAMLVSGMLF